MKRIVLSIFLLLSALPIFSADALFGDELAFKGGERAVYNIYYNLGPIWLHAANVEFSAKERMVEQTACFDLQVTGNTIRSFDKMYTIRDTFAATVKRDGLQTLTYRESKHEDSYNCDKRYRYEWNEKGEKAKVYFVQNRKGKVTKDTMDVEQGIRDLISTCYHFRGVDMSKVSKGQSIPFKMVLDNEIFELKLKYCGSETIKLRNKKKYKALKFKPQVVTGDIFEDNDALAVYVSDDENHVPLYIEAKIKVGYLKVQLDNVSGTKTPMSSLVAK